MKGTAVSTTPSDGSTAGVSDADDEERSERAVERSETTNCANGERCEP